MDKIKNSSSSPRQASLWQRIFNFEQNQTSLALLLITPSIVLTLGLVLFPILNTLIMSFQDLNLARPDRTKFVGIGNYVEHLTDDFFWETIGRTAYFTFVSVGLEVILGVAIALLIAQKLHGWRFIRLAIIIPWAVPTIVSAMIWRWIYNADYGALNGLLYQMGLIENYQAWLAEPWRAMNLVIIADVWHSVPFVVLIISAALASLPEELYDAAAVDGANPAQRFLFITLPLLRPALLVIFVIRTVEAFRVFDIIYIITRGGPVNGTMVISYLTYEETFRFLKLGSGASLSFLVSLFILVLALVYIRVLHTDDRG